MDCSKPYKDWADLNMIPYGRQDITQADVDAVVDVLRSECLTQGPAVPHFENAVAAYCGVRHALALNSATSALHVACLALGLGPGDRLWTTPITFVASSNCALYCGAKVDFVDIDPKTYNLSVERLAEKLAHSEKQGTLPKVLVAVHLCGQPSDMMGIYSLSQRYGFKVIEDASHAIGGRYRNEPIGNCRYCDITVFSFHPVKIITTGEGGMVLTQQSELAQKMALLRSHGITRDVSLMTHEPDGPWYYQQVDLGFNYRMTDLQAALGISQMKRLDAYVQRRQILAKIYEEQLTCLPVQLPYQHADGASAWHLYVVRLKLDEIKRSHREVFEFLRAAGIGANLHYIPVHTQPYYARMGFSNGDFPQAERYYREAITLPMFPTLTDAQQGEVVERLAEALGA
jgi:UDP-4-amino-4,6-dideoxy-N-acetyl-beta-L-altrosamine transaminase